MSLAELFVGDFTWGAYNQRLCDLHPKLRDTCVRMANKYAVSADDLVETRCGITQALMEYLWLGKHVEMRLLGDEEPYPQYAFGSIRDDRDGEVKHVYFVFQDEGEWYQVESCNLGPDDDRPIRGNIVRLVRPPARGKLNVLSLLLYVPATPMPPPHADEIKARLATLACQRGK